LLSESRVREQKYSAFLQARCTFRQSMIEGWNFIDCLIQALSMNPGVWPTLMVVVCISV